MPCVIPAILAGIIFLKRIKYNTSTEVSVDAKNTQARVREGTEEKSKKSVFPNVLVNPVLP